MVLIGLAVGAVFGLIPLALGLYKGKKKLALLGFVISAAAGAIWSLLALVPVIVFSILIMRNPKAAAIVDKSSIEDSKNL